MFGILLLIIAFAIANFFYFVFPIRLNLLKRFSISLSIIILFTIFYCLIDGDGSMLEAVITFGGYFSILSFAHLLLIKVFKVENYYLYLVLFFLLFILISVFYTALMQDIFNYS